jgi:hypothetical protein
MKGDKNKIVSLPENVIKVLVILSTKERLPVKRYMENILINHAKASKTKH